MTTIKVNFHDGNTLNGRNNISGFNNIGGATITGVRVADLLDPAGATTGVSLTMTTAFTGDVGSSTIATISPDVDFPVEFFHSGFYGGSETLDLSGLPPGASYTLKLSGASKQDRDTNYTATSGTPSPALYDNIVGDPPTTPITITGTVPGNGVIDITAAGTSSFSYVNGFMLEYAPSGPTATNIDGGTTFTPGASVVLNGSNFSLTGGSITIGGVTQTITLWTATAITFTAVRGGNPYDQDLTLVYTDASSNTANLTVQQVAGANESTTTAASPNTVDDASLWTGLVDTVTGNPITIVNGDQALLKDVNALGNLTATPAGEISADTEGNFTAQIRLASEGVWGGDQVVTFEIPVVDEIAPTVLSVLVPLAGSYKAGSVLSFTVNFSEVVTVTGFPQLALNIGGTTRQAVYASGSGTSALVFSYTVQAGDNDPDGISVVSLGLNGGTIVDQASTPNPANLILNAIGVTVGILIDTIKPVISPIGANPATVILGNAYADAGALASDDQDGPLGAVVGSGVVDVNTIGQYIITYLGAGVTDSAGNVADDVTRLVNVVEAEDEWPFSKGVKYSAPEIWQYGGRHPMTQMRVRKKK